MDNRQRVLLDAQEEVRRRTGKTIGLSELGRIRASLEEDAEGWAATPWNVRPMVIADWWQDMHEGDA